MPRRQTTLASSGSVSGIGLHTGAVVTLTLLPAPINHGIQFKHNSRVIDAHVSHVRNTERHTALGEGESTILTVEHVLSALYGMEVDNVLIELTAHEPPICDGSAKAFVELIRHCRIIKQDALTSILKLREPIRVEKPGGSILLALPYDGLRVTCTFADSVRNITQYHDLVITSSNYATDISQARTFVAFEDVEGLRQLGLIKGGVEGENALVIRDGKVPPLLWPDELARHKVLDFVGDLALLGRRVEAHFVLVKPGHGVNAALVRELARVTEGCESESRL